MALIAVAAASINVLMAVYNVGKDVCGFAKNKIRGAKKMQSYKESLEWKKNSLRRTKSRVGQRINKFGTETVILHGQWVNRVAKADEQLNQYLARCENANRFHQRARLGETGSVLAKEVDKLVADGKIFDDPRYGNRQSSNVLSKTQGANRYMDNLAVAGDTRNSSSSWNRSGGSRTSLFSSSANTNMGSFALSEDKSRRSSWNRSSSSRSHFASTASRNTDSIVLSRSRSGSSRMSHYSLSASTSTGSIASELRSRSSRSLSSSSARSSSSRFSSTVSTSAGSIGSSKSTSSSRSVVASTASRYTDTNGFSGSTSSGRIVRNSTVTPSSPTWSTRAVRGESSLRRSWISSNS